MNGTKVIDNYPAAVVLGLSETGLAVARSLGRKGITVYGVHTSSEHTPPAASSRYLRFRPSPDVDDEQAFLAFLEVLAEEAGKGAVLLPTGDQNVLFLHKYREKLSRFFSFLLWDSSILTEATSKIFFSNLATRLNLPCPHTIVPADCEDLVSQLGCLHFPCVIKPDRTHLWLNDRAKDAGFYGMKAIPAETPEQLLTLYRKIAAVDNRLIVQEQIVGPDQNHEDYISLTDKDGITVAEFTARKLRLTPPHFGMGCFVQSTDDPELKKEGRRVMSLLGVRGMGGLNFKRDERDGRLYLFEINPRFLVWSGLAISCGVDFPYYVYQLCLGEKPDFKGDYATGKIWWNPHRDLMSLKTYLADETWTIPGWLRSLLRVNFQSHFCIDDPSPGLHSYGEILKLLKSHVRSRRN